MRRRTRSLLAFSAFSAILVLATVGPAEALPKPKEKWLRAETGNFALISNASESRTVEIGRNLEVLREVLKRTSTGLEVNSPLPTKIYVFKNASSFNRYNVHKDGEPANISGFFVKAIDGNYVALDASAGADSFDVIYHEYLHYFLGNNLPDLPLWINEGLAEFYSTFKWRGSGAELGHAIPRHVIWLRGHARAPLSDLFAVTPDSPVYNEGERQGTFYAQSWAFTHYLMMRDDGKSIGKLVKALGQRDDTAATIEKLTGRKLAELEQDFASYLEKLDFEYFTFKFDEKLSEREVEVRPLEHPDVLYELGELLTHTPPLRLDVAEEHLLAALALTPERAACHTALGKVRSLQGRQGEAVEYYRKAISLDATDASAYKAYASQLVTSWYESTDRSQDGTAPELLEARKLYRKSLELSPGDYASMAGLGQTFIQDSGDTSEGIDALTRAARGLPSRPDILFNLFVLHINADHEESAKRIFDEVLRYRADRANVESAEDMLLQFDVARAQEHLNAGQVDEAVTLLRAVTEKLHDTAYKQRIVSQIMSIEGSAVSKVDVDRYNEAVALIQAGKVDDAMPILEELAAGAKEPSLSEMAASTLAALKRNRLIERYNAALEQAKAQNLDVAVRELNEILELDPDEDLRERIESMLSQLGTPKNSGRR